MKSWWWCVVVLCGLLAGPALADGPADLSTLWGLKLNDVAGKPQPLSAYRGKVLVLNFWATWCPPCRREMPGFARLQEQYRDKGVQFVGIAIDTPENVRDFSIEHPVGYPLLIGGNGGVELSRRLGNSSMGLPYTLVVDARGEVRRQKLGGYAEAALAADLQAILR